MLSRKDAILSFLLAWLFSGCQSAPQRPGAPQQQQPQARQQPAVPAQPLPAVQPPQKTEIQPASAPGDVQPGSPPPAKPVAPEPALPAPPELKLGGEAVEALPMVPGSKPEATLYQQAMERYATMDSYIAKFQRREQVNGKDKGEELMLFKFRKQPWSVHFRWLEGEGKGREVTYVKGQYGDKMHTLLAPGDPGAILGKMSLAPDSSLVRANSRHAITDAGIGNLIDRFGRLLAEDQARGTRQLTYQGLARRPEFDTLVHEVAQTIAPKVEPHLPAGGSRKLYFDPASKLPLLLITWDETGQQVEFYCYTRLLFPVKLNDDDFNPANLGQTLRR